MSDSHERPLPDPELAQILDALELPREAMRSWFSRIQTFCQQHGGERHYAELLALMAECQENLE